MVVPGSSATSCSLQGPSLSNRNDTPHRPPDGAVTEACLSQWDQRVDCADAIGSSGKTVLRLDIGVIPESERRACARFEERVKERGYSHLCGQIPHFCWME